MTMLQRYAGGSVMLPPTGPDEQLVALAVAIYLTLLLLSRAAGQF